MWEEAAVVSSQTKPKYNPSPSDEKRINLQHLDGYERGSEGRERWKTQLVFIEERTDGIFPRGERKRGVWKRV